MRKNPASYQVFPGNDDVTFLRKGEVGDWKNHLTPEMNDQIEKEFVDKMRENGLEFDWWKQNKCSAGPNDREKLVSDDVNVTPVHVSATSLLQLSPHNSNRQRK